MAPFPELTDDAIVELAREGGFAWLPRLSGQRRIVLAALDEERRRQVCEILRQILPLGLPPGRPDSPGQGDQRYYRIQITWTRHVSAQYQDVILLVPETGAPPALKDLWEHGEACGDP